MGDDYDKSKITDKIYLGSYYGATDLEYLKKENINKVLSCLGSNSPEYEDINIKQKIISVDDLPNCNIIQYFKECIEFLDENENDKIFVHCMCGVSRSSSIVIAYLLWKTRASYYEAYFFVKNRRVFIAPNDGFIIQLQIFEKLLKENDYDLNKINLNKVKWPQ